MDGGALPAVAARRRARRNAAGGTSPGDGTAIDLAASALAFHHMPGHYIRRLQQVAVALFAQRVDGVDITPVQFAALAALEHQRTCDQATLGALIGYDRATIGGVVDRLEAKRWIAREPGRADRRMKLVSLTSAGAAVLRRVTRDVERVQADLMAPLTPSQRRQFERLCQKLLAGHAG
jgi:DNA-binding MarR family transcriptional regulator